MRARIVYQKNDPIAWDDPTAATMHWIAACIRSWPDGKRNAGKFGNGRWEAT